LRLLLFHLFFHSNNFDSDGRFFVLIVSVAGCVNTTLDCVAVISGVIIGLTTGIIAAIVVAAVIAACALAGGGAYAANNALNQDATTEVMSNPLYCGNESEHHNPLHSH
jgi:hypothetical protein